MKKILVTMLVILLAWSTPTAFASSNIPIYVNGQLLTPDVSPYIENDRTFVPIRFIGEALSASSIDWDGSNRAAILTFNNTTMYLPIDSRHVSINGQSYTIDAPIRIKSNRTFVPIRLISEILGYNVQWVNHSAYISNNGYAPPKEEKKYSSEDIYWLSRIVNAEAGSEPYEGKLAVANVIINRKNSSEFPNTIKGVVFDTNYGVQFTPTSDGSVYNTPSEASITAATHALNGQNNVGDALYFLNPAKSTNFWIMHNRPFYTQIKNHHFYG
ncbi:cell wall hydrolase [Vallitalea pronyensis]|uniref:Cell wall hydrolase n=1 Tax=Vallitalea pronyensis TaxID=1348613 RepID=A0A8J8SGU2_9FIRM|nr:stalk domain-containing protein [Vallitalea pronyensis]QUI22678.1 cell wall hydrolase [Vallitalea pronyensis]